MAAFKQLVAVRRGFVERNIEKIDNKLNFGNHTVPDFWHRLVDYEEILIVNNLEIVFSLNINNDNYYNCSLYHKERNTRVCDVTKENISQYLSLICKYNIVFKLDCYICGVSYEIFNSNGIRYAKNIKLTIDHDDFINNVEWHVRNNPDYNFAKFNDNSDIKIALKD